MKKAPLRLTTALILALGISSVASAKSLFDNFYFFGDSLSDMGNNQAEHAPITSGGSTWANYFANKFDNSATPSNNGGNDYAYAGALTGFVVAQFNNYLASTGKRVDSNALYSIWAGANDINVGLQFGETPQEIIAIGTGNTNTIVEGLHNAGAKYIMVFNLPDLGRTPLGESKGAYISGVLSQVSWAYNQTLASALNADGFDVIQVDIYSLFNDLLDDPHHFGLANANDLFYTPTGADPNLDEHPTGAGHQMIADYAYSVIEGPTRAAILAEAPFSVMDAQNFNIENQLFNVRSNMTKLATAQTTFFASASYSPYKQDSQGTQGSGFDAHNTDFTAGIVHRINNNLIAGAAFAHSYGPVDLGKKIGGFDIAENITSLFGGYQYNKFYTDGIVNLGVINFNNFTRNIPIGPSQNLTHGETNGLQFGADLVTGYNLINRNNLQTGPLVNVDYQNIRVDAYAEKGSIGGIAENFDSQNNNSLTTGFGWMFNYIMQVKNIQLMPFAQLTYNHQWITAVRNVGAGLVSLPGSHFTIPVSAPNGDFGLANIGISTNLVKNVNLSLGYNTTLYKEGSRSQNISASIQVSI